MGLFPCFPVILLIQVSFFQHCTFCDIYSALVHVTYLDRRGSTMLEPSTCQGHLL